MNRRKFYRELSRATASVVCGVGVSSATRMESAKAYRPMPDGYSDGGNKKKRRRKDRGDGNGNGNRGKK